MSIFSDFFDSLLGTDSTASSQASALDTHPCANCPSNCTIAGAACDVCAPYKKKLIDAVYYVDHLDEFKAQYEVVGLTGAASAITCPYCGAQTQNHQVCEYCGSKLSEDSGKIKVASASDIPNPIMQAQDIIFERYETVIRQYTAANKTDDDGILDNILDVLTGTIDDDTDSNAMGAKMSEAEIKEAASLYGVSVGEYLTGLDNGKYLTLAGRKAAASSSSSSADSFTPAAAGVAGIAGIGAFANYLFNDYSHYHRPDHYERPQRRDDHVRPQDPPRPGGPAPSQRPGSSVWQSQPQPAQRRDQANRRTESRPDSRPDRRGTSSPHHSGGDHRNSGRRH